MNINGILYDLEMAVEGVNASINKDYKSVSKIVNKSTSAAKKAMKSGNYSEAIRLCDEGIKALNDFKARVKKSGAETDGVILGNLMISAKTMVKAVLGLLLVASACVLGAKSYKKYKNKTNERLKNASMMGADYVKINADAEYQNIRKNINNLVDNAKTDLKNASDDLNKASDSMYNAVRDMNKENREIYLNLNGLQRTNQGSKYAAELIDDIENDINEVAKELQNAKVGNIAKDVAVLRNMYANDTNDIADRINRFDDTFNQMKTDKKRLKDDYIAHKDASQRYKDLSQKYDVKIPEKMNLPENTYVYNEYGSGISDALSKRIIAVGTKKGGAGIVAAGAVAAMANFLRSSFSKKNANVKSILAAVDVSIKTLAAIKGTCKELMKTTANESIVSSCLNNNDQSLDLDENITIFFDTISECLINISPNDSLLESMLVLGFDDYEACDLYIDYISK